MNIKHRLKLLFQGGSANPVLFEVEHWKAHLQEGSDLSHQPQAPVLLSLVLAARPLWRLPITDSPHPAGQSNPDNFFEAK